MKRAPAADLPAPELDPTPPPVVADPPDGAPLRSRAACAVYRRDGAPVSLQALGDISDVLAREPDAFLWLDVVDASIEDFAVIQEEFGLHPLAIEDAVKAHERPKIEAYRDVWFLVVQAATREDDQLRLHEVAIFAAAHFVVTVRARPPYPLGEFERRWQHDPKSRKRDGGVMLYQLLDTIVDGYRPIAEAFEEHVERLEGALLGDAARTKDVLIEIFEMKKELAHFRRAVTPLREMLAPILRGDMHLFRPDDLPYLRDVYDHVSLVVDQLDAARDLINNARDTHVAVASNRQAEVSKQLTIVATVFLPLTFITGFFGQNFGFLVNHIASEPAFWWLGIGTEIIGLVALLGYFRVKGWF